MSPHDQLQMLIHKLQNLFICKGNPLFARLLRAPTAEPPTADRRDRRRYPRVPSEY